VKNALKPTLRVKNLAENAFHPKTIASSCRAQKTKLRLHLYSCFPEPCVNRDYASRTCRIGCYRVHFARMGGCCSVRRGFGARNSRYTIYFWSHRRLNSFMASRSWGDSLSDMNYPFDGSHRYSSIAMNSYGSSCWPAPALYSSTALPDRKSICVE
jgi:hypothetical protein